MTIFSNALSEYTFNVNASILLCQWKEERAACFDMGGKKKKKDIKDQIPEV